MKKNIKNIFRYIRPGRRGLLVLSLGLFIGLTGIIVYLKTSGHKAEASAWMNDSWLYRTAYTITNAGSAINAERKVKFDIDTTTLITAGKMQSDCDDARFTDASGKQLAYFIDTATGACNTNSTDFYVKVPAVLAGKQTIYFYYGNASATQGRQPDFFSNNTIGEGLVAYYSHNESSANTCTGGSNDACDSAAGSYDASWNGNAAYTASGKVGGGISLYGTGDYVNISTNYGISNKFSASVWFKTTATNAALFGQASVAPPSVPASFVPILFITSAGTLRGELWTGATTGITSIGTVNDGQWHHAVITGDTSTQSLYLDGALVGNRSGTIDQSWWVASTIGTGYDSSNRGGTGTGWKDLNGTMDDVRLYKRALSGAEVTTIYNNSNPTEISVPLTFTQSATATGSEEKGQGPVAYWSFDEGQGTTAQDSTAGNNDGTLTNGPQWRSESECISGKCLYFDGSDDYVSTSYVKSSGDGTLSVWFKGGSQNSDSSSSLRPFIMQGGAGQGNPAGMYIAMFGANNSSNHGKIGFKWGNDSNEIITSNTYNDNKWHFSSVVKSSTTITAYIDGVVVGTTTASDTLSTSTNVLLGGSTINPTARKFKGFIDEPKIYSYARTAAQIRQDYAARSSVKGVDAQIGSNTATQQLSNGLVAYYPMDEASANSCTGGTNDTCDKSGNGNDGAWNGDAASGAGKYGNGVSFDGTGDYVTVNKDYNFDTNNQVTFSTWVKFNSVSGWQTIIGQDTSTFVNNGAFYFQKLLNSNPGCGRTANTIGFVIPTGSGGCDISGVYSNTVIATGNWYHVVVTYDSSIFRIYVNGSLENSTTSNVSIAAQTGNLAIASGYYSDTLTDNLKGSLDEVRIYNRALSSSEVRALYNYAPGPVAHWKLDDKTGTSASDVSGNSNSGTLTNSPAWTAGKYGSAVRFDGSDDYITAADSSSLDVTRSASWAFWFNLASLPSGADGKFIDKWIGTGNQRSYQIYPTTTNKISVDISSDGTSGAAVTLNSSDTISANTWTHASVTYDGATVRMYINGNLQSSTAAISGIFNSTANMSIGGDNLGSTNFANGRMDDVRIYNYALSSKQIMNIMAGGEVTDTAVAPVSAARGGPVLSMNFDEGYGTTARDASSQGNSGTLTNMASPATATSGWSNSGKYGKALAFDGSNDYVTVADQNMFSFGNGTTDSPFSACSWIKMNDATSFRLVAKYDAVDNYEWLLNTGNDDKLYFYLVDDSVGDPSGHIARYSNTALTPYEGQWVHVCGTYTAISGGESAVNDIRIYLNGKRIDDSTSNGGGTYVAMENTAAPVWVGRLSNAYANGLIDDVKVYPYALTEDEVRLEYNRGSALVFGAKSTAADGTTADNSAGREYCVPGDTATCAAPVAEWKLDDASGTSAQDTSGGGNTGTLTNGPVWTKGKLGKALKFDGSDDYVTVTDSNSLDSSSQFTVSTWVNPQRFAGSNQTQGFILSKGSYPDYNYRLSTDSVGGNRFQVAAEINNSFTYLSTTNTFNTNRWYYLTGTYDGSTLKIYVDGILENSSSISGSLTTNTNAIYFGRYEGATDWMYQGLIDNVRIYNYARTPAQIAWEYNKGAPVAHYRLDECQGTTAYNSAPTASGDAPGNNGSISIGAGGTNTSAGACTGSSGEAWKDGASGKLGASLEFDGSDDYVTMGDVNSLDFNSTQSFSTSAWFKTSSNGGYYTIVGKKTAPNSTANGWAIYQRVTNSIIGFRTADGTDVIATETTGTYNDNSWHHVIGIIDRTTQMQHLYIDGILVRSSSASSLDDLSNGANLMIGASTSSTNLWNGQIDDVRIYNYALTPVQVRSLYNDGAVSFK